jgi:xanthine/CO dehydrogenase XdhC/CoxF family maturation factor
MFVTEDGRTTGVVSGGCLEGDVRERSARVMQTGTPTLVRYDTTTDEDLVWGLGLGCNGVVDVLIEPANERTDHLLGFLEACSNSQECAACATVIRSEEIAEVALGSRVLLFPDGAVKADAEALGSAALKNILIDLQTAARTAASFMAQYVGDNLEVFIEAVEPPLPLIIFGAGADAVPLVTMAKRLGWAVTVVDTHARARSHERFADADAVVLSRPEDLGSRLTFTDSTAAVVMTHNYLHDLEVLKTLLSRSLRYIGCLGPKRRTERLLSRLPDVPDAVDTLRSGQLHAPVGIDIGAETSSEIALSIVAEILAVLRERPGGSLRARQAAIHGHAPAVTNADAARTADASLLTGIACHAGV